jgi:hypothetical protein
MDRTASIRHPAIPFDPMYRQEGLPGRIDWVQDMHPIASREE